MTSTPKYVSAREAAEIVGVAYETLLSYVSREKDPLPSGRTGTSPNSPIRISLADIEEWLKSHARRLRGEDFANNGDKKAPDPVAQALQRVREQSGRRF